MPNPVAAYLTVSDLNMKKYIFILWLTTLLSSCNVCLETFEEQHLGDVTNSQTNLNLTYPDDAETFSLVIGMPYINAKPDMKRKLPNIDGTIKIYSGNDLIQSFKINRNELENCNWLNGNHELDGFIINSGEKTMVKPGNNYELEIELKDNSHMPFSLWLFYIKE